MDRTDLQPIIRELKEKISLLNIHIEFMKDETNKSKRSTKMRQKQNKVRARKLFVVSDLLKAGVKSIVISIATDRNGGQRKGKHRRQTYETNKFYTGWSKPNVYGSEINNDAEINTLNKIISMTSKEIKESKYKFSGRKRKQRRHKKIIYGTGNGDLNFHGKVENKKI